MISYVRKCFQNVLANRNGAHEDPQQGSKMDVGHVRAEDCPSGRSSVLVGTDGVWKQVSAMEANEIVLREGVRDGCAAVVRLARERGSVDDFVCKVKLRNCGTSLRQLRFPTLPHSALCAHYPPHFRPRANRALCSWRIARPVQSVSPRLHLGHADSRPLAMRRKTNRRKIDENSARGGSRNARKWLPSGT